MTEEQPKKKRAYRRRVAQMEPPIHVEMIYLGGKRETLSVWQVTRSAFGWDFLVSASTPGYTATLTIPAEAVRSVLIEEPPRMPQAIQQGSWVTQGGTAVMGQPVAVYAPQGAPTLPGGAVESLNPAIAKRQPFRVAKAGPTIVSETAEGVVPAGFMENLG